MLILYGSIDVPREDRTTVEFDSKNVQHIGAFNGFWWNSHVHRNPKLLILGAKTYDQVLHYEVLLVRSDPLFDIGTTYGTTKAISVETCLRIDRNWIYSFFVASSPVIHVLDEQRLLQYCTTDVALELLIAQSP